MINTPFDLIVQTLKRTGVLGIGQTPTAEDCNDAFDALNGMIAQWNRKRWLVWAIDDIAFSSTGANSYTIGPGSNFNTPRPDKLEAAYVRLLPVSNGQPIDTWLNIINSHEDYATITLKNLQTWPSNVFYDTQFPIGNLLFWPVPPTGQFEMHVLVKNQIVPFTSIQENISADIPPEYFEALSWNLAARLRPSYQLPPDIQVTNLAKIALNVLRQANVQVSVLKTPYGYPNSNNRGYGWTLGISGGFA